MTTTKLSKVIRVGSGPSGDVYCKIEWDGSRLSISGVEGPMRNGDARGGAGQIVMHDWDIDTYAPGWNAALVHRLRAVWDRWHLNDMRAGTPRQSQALRDAGGNPDYDAQCAILKSKGLLDDDGYRYGTKWLSEDVPADVIDFLASLPDADKIPAWV